jgi:hypothetical protein
MYVINWDQKFSKAYYSAVIESEAIIRAILKENKKLQQRDKEWIRAICILKWAKLEGIDTKIIYINAEKKPAYMTKWELDKYVKEIKKMGVIEYIRNILRKVKVRADSEISIKFASYHRGANAWWVKVVK